MNAATPLKVREALTAAIARHDPLIVLTGAGTAALCRPAIESAGVTAAWLDAHSTITFHEILQRAAADLQAGANPPATADDLAMAASEQELLDLIRRAVDTNPRRAAAIVVDEAHQLSRFVVARVLTLVELAAPDRGLTVVLAGQPAFDAVVDRPECLTLRQRITTRLRLSPAPKTPVATPPKEVVPANVRTAVRPARLIAVGGSLVLILGIGWAVRAIARRPTPTQSTPVAATPPAATAPTPPAPQVPPPVATVTAPVTSSLPDTGKPSTPETEAQLDRLHRTMEREAIELAGRGDVDGLVKLRATTEAAYRQIGARRPDFLSALLGELDGYMNRARGGRRPQ